MKLKIFFLAILAAGAVSARAQTNQTTLDKILAVTGGLTNYAVEPYFTFAPSAPTTVGGGILGIYNVSEHVGLNVGLDWLGDFSLLSGGLTLSAPFHPLPQQFPNVVLNPFVLADVATAYSGAGQFNGNLSTATDVGAAIKFGHALGGQFNVGAAWGKWSGVGPYDVTRYHFFIGWSHGF